MKKRFETFTALISKINRSVKRIKNYAMRAYGLRGVQVSCIYYLYTEDGLTSTDLAERCEEDKATISRAILTLRELGYIEEEKASARRYKSPLTLTKRGEEAGRQVAERVADVLDSINDRMTEEERLSFYKNLGMISEGLSQICSLFEEEEEKSSSKKGEKL